MGFRTYSLKAAMLACAAGGLLVPAAPAGATSLPAGTYQKLCSVVQIDTVRGRMTALCKAPGNKTKLNRDWQYKYCVGDIGVIGGYLRCAVDQQAASAGNAAQAQADAEAKAKADAEAQAKKDAADAAKAAKQAESDLQESQAGLEGAGLIVLGVIPTAEERAGYVAQMTSGEYGYTPVNGDFSYKDGIAFFKKLLAKPANAGLRGSIISLAFQEALGRDPTAQEFAQYDNAISGGKAWYTTIIADQHGKMALDGSVRRAMIERAYTTAMGRYPYQADLDYWLGSEGTYGLIMSASRRWLYGPQGITDRVATTKRALAAKGQPTTDAAIVSAMQIWGPTQAIYDEMLTFGPGGTVAPKPIAPNQPGNIGVYTPVAAGDTADQAPILAHHSHSIVPGGFDV